MHQGGSLIHAEAQSTMMTMAAVYLPRSRISQRASLRAFDVLLKRFVKELLASPAALSARLNIRLPGVNRAYFLEECAIRLQLFLKRWSTVWRQPLA